ncbi:MAG: NADH-quinone oxidoreductase subunit F [Dehalococcoidia bacterium]|nr:NADH-quinone oxidoreductase subunit F [Dehalococcoidia bacterium]
MCCAIPAYAAEAAPAWEGILTAEGASRFVVANGAEGEPGTFKDRYLLRRNPYAVLEGLLIATQVIGAERAYLGLKEAFHRERESLSHALAEFRSLTELADKIEVVLGSDEYLLGEEKALLEVIEGGLPLPRVLPPYMHGLFAGSYGGAETNPTVVNNVETLAFVPGIVRNGASWFRSLGSEDTPGTMIFTVCGDVRRPMVEELPLGLTLRELIYDVAGGPKRGQKLKAIFPGLANGVLTPDGLDARLGFDSMRSAGASLGSAGFIVYDDSACMVQVAYLFSRFLHVESCNQCPPCKLYSGQITEALERLLAGIGSHDDIEQIQDAAATVEDGQRCYLPTSERSAVTSIMAAFIEDFGHHIAPGHCELNHNIELPKIVDYSEVDGFTFDPLYSRKQPDWTYALAAV